MSFWRMEDPVIENGTVIRGGMWKHQRDWWSLTNRIRLLVGGYGAGKSINLCKWGIAMALHNAPSWFALVSPSFPMARRTLIPTMEELLDGKASLRPDMTWKHNKGDHSFDIKIECQPPAKVLYLSGDNPTSLKGPNLCGAGLDEPFIQEKAVFDQMLSRTRDPRAKTHALGLAGTPEELNWGYDIVEGELKGRYDVGYVVADTRDNKALPPDYAKSLLQAFDPKMAEAYVSGKFVNLSTGRVYYAFSKERNVKRQDQLSGAHFVGMDFNVNPMSFVVGCHQGNKCHIYAERELPNSDTVAACDIIRREFPKVKVVFPDPTGKRRQTNSPAGVSDFTWIQRSGLIVLAPHAPHTIRDSLNAVNAMYASGDLTVDPSCTKLINYLTNHSWERIKQQEAMTHLLDGHRYAIAYLYPVYRPSTTKAGIVGL